MNGWVDYLTSTLKADLPSSNGAKSGTYTITIHFKVDTNGDVFNVKAQNNPGFGTEAEAIRVISKSSGYWLPEIEDNHPAISDQTQQITFQVL